MADALQILAGVLDRHLLLVPPQDLDRYQTSVMGDYKGVAAFVVRPRSTEEVRQVVAWAFRHRVRLVVQGANTGLVRAALPDASGRVGVLSLELCRDRLEVDVLNRTVTASAGYDLDTLNQHLAVHDLFLPIDLGASPAVGGMVSTNTGGAKMAGYGDVRTRTLGLEVVMADEDATALDLLAGLRKNNTGLDVKQLFIGTAGAYGVVTAATFEVARRPKQVATAWVVVPDDEATFRLLGAIEASAGDFLKSYEFVSGSFFDICKRNHPTMRLPFTGDRIPEMAVLVELATTVPETSGLSVADLLVSILDEQASRGLVVDAVMGASRDLWSVRHRGNSEIQKEGVSHWVDVSVPRSALAQFRTSFFALVEQDHPEWIPIVLGHYADGGLHTGVVLPHSCGRSPRAFEVEAIRDSVYDLVDRLGGTFSAEHGIGPYNAAYYHRYKDPELQTLSGELKKLVDPRGILGVVELGPSRAGPTSRSAAAPLG